MCVVYMAMYFFGIFFAYFLSVFFECAEQMTCFFEYAVQMMCFFEYAVHNANCYLFAGAFLSAQYK